MAEMRETQTPAHTAGRERLSISRIPFLDSHPNAFSTCFQEDYKPYPVKTPECPLAPIPAQVSIQGPQGVPQYQTETLTSYQTPPLPPAKRMQTLDKFITTFKMETDPEEVTFSTTNHFQFQPKFFQPPIKAILPRTSLNSKQYGEKLPESTKKTSYTPLHVPTVTKPTVKHLEYGSPTMKGDGNPCNFASHYNDIFHGASSQRTEPVNQRSKVVFGDQTVERETTQAASFPQPAVCRSSEVVRHDPHRRYVSNVDLGHCPKDPWLSVSKESFCHRKSDPVVVVKKVPTASSLAMGDMAPEANTVWMSGTTNSTCFPQWKLPEHPVVDVAHARTKSYIQFGSAQPHPSDFYSTTSSEHFQEKRGGRPGLIPVRQSGILMGPGHGPSLSTTQADFVPLKSRRTPLIPQRSNVRFPVTDPDFSTTHSAHYTAKSYAKVPPTRTQSSSQFTIQ